jgi:hypothetical protein
VKALFAVAPNFQCKGSWADRLLVAAGDSWRAPDDKELAALTPSTPQDSSLGDGTACFCLFSIPMHMRTRFWAMLDEEAAEGTGDFVNFSDDLAEFLTFKELSPPQDAVCELLLQNEGGKVSTDDVWALVNFGEEPVRLGWPGLQFRLDPGEGLRMAPGSPPDVVPPANDDVNVLLAIRPASAQGG